MTSSFAHPARLAAAAVSMPEPDMLAAALDCLEAALFLIDETGRIVHANASARAMLERRSVLRAREGRLEACHAGSVQGLQAILAEARICAGRTALPLRAPDGKHCIAHLVPLASGPWDAGVRHGAIAALVVHEVVLAAPAPPEAIAALYGLTPSEVRVLLAIVEVGGVRETAEALGLSEATVKTHLHRVFGKTGANRQADLVKLVAGSANPFAGTFRRTVPARLTAA